MHSGFIYTEIMGCGAGRRVTGLASLSSSVVEVWCYVININTKVADVL